MRKVMSSHDTKNTYFIDPKNPADVVRLNRQGTLLDRHTDTVPQEFVPWENKRILDLACGPGGWALKVASKFPLVTVVALDIDEFMIRYARAQAEVQEQDRVQFYLANILKPIDFPDASFDFINARFLQSLMRTSDWDSLAKECFRLTKPGGLIRMTETGARIVLAPKQQRVDELLSLAFWRTKMSFCEFSSSVSPLLKQFLGRVGYRVIREVPYLLNLSYGTEFYEPLVEGARTTLHLIKPFILKHVPEAAGELDELFEGVLRELASEDHTEHWFITSVIGQKPE